MADLRRIVSTVVIVSFSLAALMGIVALLTGGDFGQTEANVLLTTVIVGLESVAMLCYLAAVGRPFAAVAYVGAPTSLAAAGTALYLTWGNDSGEGWADLAEAFGVLLTLAASLAQVSLLLALTQRRRMTAALVATLAAVTVVAVMVVVGIVGEGLGNGYWRTLGVAAILDVLGTVVLTAASAFRRGGAPPAAAPLLAPDVQQRLVAAARARGTTPSQLVDDALDVYLA